MAQKKAYMYIHIFLIMKVSLLHKLRKVSMSQMLPGTFSMGRCISFFFVAVTPIHNKTQFKIGWIYLGSRFEGVVYRVQRAQWTCSCLSSRTGKMSVHNHEAEIKK